MKLRNKKTGGIFDVVFRSSYNDGKITIGVEVDADPKYPKYSFSDYESLEEFCKNWEDYKPVEPLIQDEKVRKAVRAWADVNGDTKLYYNRPTIEICVNDKAGYVIRSIKFKAEFREAIDIESGYYNITELCGEAE